MTIDNILFVIILLSIIAGMSIGSFVALLWCEQHLLVIAKTLSIEFISRHLDSLSQMEEGSTNEETPEP